MLKKLGLVATLLLFSACNQETNHHVEYDFSALEQAALTALTHPHFNAPAISIAILKQGEVIFAKAYGTQAHNNIKEITPNTLMEAGSITKMFTALGTLQQIEQNNIHLHSRLIDALPNIQLAHAQQQAWESITLHHLLTHQSGLPNYFHLGGDELLVTLLEGFPALFDKINPVGQFFDYSHTGSSYLGGVIQYQSGYDYHEYMDTHVFKALGMNRTTMDQSQLTEDGDYALGVGTRYDISNNTPTPLTIEKLEQVPQFAFDKPSGGYTWTTPTELLKMAHFLLQGNPDVLRDDLRQLITQPHIEYPETTKAEYGYGVVIEQGFTHNNNWYPMPIWQHFGSTSTASSALVMLPEENIAVAIQASGNQFLPENLLFEAFKSVMTLPKPSSPPYLTLTEQDKQKFVGRYHTDQFGLLEVELINNQLHVTLEKSEQTYQPILDQHLEYNDFAIVFEDGSYALLNFIIEPGAKQASFIKMWPLSAIRAENEP